MEKQQDEMGLLQWFQVTFSEMKELNKNMLLLREEIRELNKTMREK